MSAVVRTSILLLYFATPINYVTNNLSSSMELNMTRFIEADRKHQIPSAFSAFIGLSRSAVFQSFRRDFNLL